MKWKRVVFVLGGALIITSLGIDAADTLSGSSGTLLSRVIDAEKRICPEGMISVERIAGLSCVDAYEASVGDACPIPSPSQMLGTQQNLEQRTCKPSSVAGVEPWRFVSRDQAMQLCAREGKRLPSSAEWYALSLGMTQVESSCNVNTQSLSKTGAFPECATQEKIYDLVGNVWEWVSDDVIEGVYNNRTLPETGYVSQVDAQGMATVVQQNPDDIFEKDYFWARADGAYGIIRGGYYGSGSDAGIYAVHADTQPTSASAGIGFRCVK